MKRFCLLVLFFILLINKCFSQTNDPVFEIDSLPDEGILLNKDWKFHPGDNPDWSRTDFDDTKWEDINPTLDLYYLPQIRKRAIGWLRIKFRIDSSLLNKPLAFKIYQSIASEVYLNGKLLIKYGTIGNNILKTIAYRPDKNPVGILFSHPEQVIAVRFAVQGNLPIFGVVLPYSAFRFRLGLIQRSEYITEDSHKYPILNAIYFGLFFALAIIHLGIFLQYSNRKADLYFSLATLLYAIANLLFIALVRGGRTLSFISWAFLVDWMLLLPLYNLLLYLAIHHLFYLRRNLQFWAVMLINIAGIAFYFYSYKNGQIWGLALSIFLTFTLLMIQAWKEVKRGREGAAIIGVGISVYVFIYTWFFLFYAEYFHGLNLGLDNGFSLTDLLYQVSVIIVPATLSYILSRDFASTSRNLENKLKEVQYLSEKTIKQELEKQRTALESQKAIELERLRISSELHDDLGGGLSTIRVISEMLQGKEKNINPYLFTITKNSRELVQKMNEIVWALNINNDSLPGLIAYIRQYTSKYLDENGISCKVSDPENIPDVSILGTHRRDIFLLVKEALHNIAKHSGAKSADLFIEIHENLSISINDNGIGIPLSEQNQFSGNGLKNMHKRVTELGGTMLIKNQGGTTVFLSIPLKNLSHESVS